MRRVFLTVLLATAATSATADPKLPSASEVLDRMGFSPGAMQQVLAGQFVREDGNSNSKDDLAIALAFLVRVPPEKFDSELTGKRFIFRLDPNTLAGTAIEGDGSLEDFADLKLTAEEREFYTKTGPGGSINLSAAEFAAMRAVGACGPPISRVKEVGVSTKLIVSTI